MDLLDRHDLDTWLARLLLQQGRLPLETLRAYLTEARARRGGGGPTLARSLVTSGLIAPAEVQALLQAGGVAPTQAPGAVKEPGRAASRRLGEYELLEELGAGGMGRVYLARHVRTGTRYALKTLIAADPELLARFQREGEGQARVDDHPHVVKVHSLGRDGATWFLVMDLVQGGSLEERLRGGPPPPEVAARWVRDLALAVAHAHARGVLHRDLKPQNVLFDGEAPRLVDFGLAKLVDARSLTATGTVLGTPSYMAPEQVDGARGAVTTATDVYGLGAVLYCCLTGRPPFVGASAMSTMLQVLEEPPVPPRTLRPGVPVALEAVCLRALEKDPARRFPTAAELALALERALAGEPVPSDRRRRLLWVAPAVALAIVVGLAVAPSAPDPRAPSRPPAPAASTVPSPPHVGRDDPAEDTSEAPAGPPVSWLVDGPVPGLDELFVHARALRTQALRAEESHPTGLRWRAVAVLRGLVATPPSWQHGRAYRELGLLYDELGLAPRAIQCLARAALAGNHEAPAALGLSLLPPEEQPLETDGAWRLDLARNGPLLGGAGFDMPDELATACFVLALNEARPDGSTGPWSPGGSTPLRAVARQLERRRSSGPLPSYAQAYRRVWEAFPGARLPGAEPPSAPGVAWLVFQPVEGFSGDYERARRLLDTFTSADEQITEEVARRRREEAISVLRRLLDSPPSCWHGRAYRLLARAHDQLGQPDRTLEALARAALAGDPEAAVLLGLSTLPTTEQPTQLRSWTLPLLERGPALGFVGLDRPDELGRALLVVALHEARPDGTTGERPPADSKYLHTARARLDEVAQRGVLPPAYDEAYRRVWDTFATARPVER